MATFRKGGKTHQAVLHQRPALESESVDTPGIRDETGFGGHSTAAVAGHVRGETGAAAPGGAGVTPDFIEVGEKHREVHPSVFVIDRHGRPLDPCRPARARKLLKAGRAVVHRRTPFVIRLKDRELAESEVEGCEVGVDPGSKHTGIAVFAARSGVRHGRFALVIEHRGRWIRQKMERRSTLRRARRSRNLRYRAPRFHNRRRARGWLPPSLRHQVESVASWVERIARWVPVRTVHMELARFDTHALSAGRPLEGVEYQRGTLHGFEAREYLLAKWDRSCAYCGVTGVPLNIDHIHPRGRGGSDRLSNLVIACGPCNQDKDSRSLQEFLQGRPRTLAKVLSQVRAPLRDAAVVQSTRWALLRRLRDGFPTSVSSGGRTKWNRHRWGLPKSHTLDALALGEPSGVREVVSTVLIAECTGRGSHARTRSDRYGFPRLLMPRQKRFFGFATGDFVRAVVPRGKKVGTHVGRVAVRASGKFNIRSGRTVVQGVHHRHVRLLQRADGYAYTERAEAGVDVDPEAEKAEKKAAKVE